MRDQDRVAARTPGTPPHVLSAIAARRWDLHREIAANPGASPELIRWMNGVRRDPAQPAAPVQRQVPPRAVPPPLPPGVAPRPSAPAKRGKIGCWFAGCGCLAVAAIMALFVFAGLGALLGLSDSETEQAPVAEATSTVDSQVAADVALFQEERAKIDELSLQLAGNPAKPLVAWYTWLDRQDAIMADPSRHMSFAASVASQTTTFREGLEASIAEAETRRSNASGSMTEGIVDAAGNGFIDIAWDAATACSAEERENWRRTGCITKEDSLTVHLLPESELGGWASKMTTVHELAHIYQRADRAKFEDNIGDYQALLDRGLFQGSEEVMADCFALTYYGEWSLDYDGGTLGYGYVCGDSERQAIRDWASSINAPMA